MKEVSSSQMSKAMELRAVEYCGFSVHGLPTGETVRCRLMPPLNGVDCPVEANRSQFEEDHFILKAGLR